MSQFVPSFAVSQSEADGLVTLEAQAAAPGERESFVRQTRACGLTLAVVCLFALVTLPVVLRGAPLRDDFDVCVSPRWTSGPERMVSELWQELGAVRLLGRFTELSIIAGLCGAVPFGAIIVIPLLVTCAVGFALYRLLSDLPLQPPWPQLGAALWFLQPLGTEAALWPAALHVPLGLLLAIGALRLFIRERLALGAVAALAASWTLEQALFALPFAVWLVAPARVRWRAARVSGVVAVALLAAFVTWPGLSTRTAVPLMARLAALAAEPAWYLKFPAVGTGMISIPQALHWSFPWGVGVLMAGALAGVLFLSPLLDDAPRVWGRRERIRLMAAFAGLAFLVSLPLMVTVPHEHGPRVFTPVWLVMAGFAACAGARLRWRRPRLTAAAGGVFAAGALLSLALSVWVRLETAHFTETASRWIGAHVRDGARVVVCDVPRTVVEPAPNGPFALHEFHERWAARAAVQYYSGRQVEIARSGVYWEESCAGLQPADLVVSFDDLRRLSHPGP